ncbi:barwin-like endoglucanase [Marasmius fiardii PR-910]|nr:barwin-like endoglucanase [Marasmius fiardii PR-910]
MVCTPLLRFPDCLNCFKVNNNIPATLYNPGLGACGLANTANQLVAAVAATVFDNFPGATSGNPTNNPICGRQAIVTYGSRSVTVTIIDRCPGCGSAGIELSPAAFQMLAPPLQPEPGRLPGTQWTVQ